MASVGDSLTDLLSTITICEGPHCPQFKGQVLKINKILLEIFL